MSGSSPLEIRIMSHAEHDELIASVECDGQEVAVVCQDLGRDRLEVFLYPRSDGLPRRFKYADFQAVVTEAKKRLLEE